VVVPVHNEERNLEQLHKELASALSAIGYPYEIVWVEDGSTDSSYSRLKNIFAVDLHSRVVKHRKNLGQTQALVTAFRYARGDVIVTIDADLQHDPQDISKLLEQILAGADAVIGWRTYRKESLIRRTIPSRIMNVAARRLLGLDIHDFGCGLKAYRAECIRDAIVEGEGHLYLPAAVGMRGYKVVEVKIKDRKRALGSSKIGVSIMHRQLLDLIFFWFVVRYWRRPLHFFGSIGLAFLGLGVLLGVSQLLRFFFYSPTTLMTPLSLMAAFLALAGIQFMTTGVLFEMMMRPPGRSLEVTPAVILSHDESIS
jgi:glycosyltransferase involved in cell wall biosynthesis